MELKLRSGWARLIGISQEMLRGRGNLRLRTKFLLLVASRSTTFDFPAPIAQKMFGLSLKEHSTAAWWVSGRRLFQVMLEPYYADVPKNGTLLGTVVVGREIDPLDCR